VGKKQDSSVQPVAFGDWIPVIARMERREGAGSKGRGSSCTKESKGSREVTLTCSNMMSLEKSLGL
jgi:hypothetical protein